MAESSVDATTLRAANRGPMTARLAALALPILIAGCACGEERYCGTGLDKPELGDAATRFWHRLARLPETTAEEFDDRGGRVVDGLGRVVDRREREIEDTGDHLAGFGPWVGFQFDERADRFWGFFDRQGERANDDTCCFGARAWHSVKRVIE